QRGLHLIHAQLLDTSRKERRQPLAPSLLPIMINHDPVAHLFLLGWRQLFEQAAKPACLLIAAHNLRQLRLNPPLIKLWRAPELPARPRLTSRRLLIGIADAQEDQKLREVSVGFKVVPITKIPVDL